MDTLRRHWPEYAIEAWALGMFMVSAACFGVLLDYPGSPAHSAIASADVRRALAGVAMGLTAVALIYSPWGQRSGAHMNPAVTLTYLRLGRIRTSDAAGYIVAQFLGGTLGLIVAAAVLGPALAEPPVRYVVTQPGPLGVLPAALGEVVISAVMMLLVLAVSSRPAVARYTGLVAGTLVAAFITFEGPLSGMSMNPARSFASAWSAGEWHTFWLYLLAPVAGMQLGSLAYPLLFHRRPTSCAKLVHGAGQRCIHCGYEPQARGENP